jgi:hypothetical protein
LALPLRYICVLPLSTRSVQHRASSFGI